MACLLILTAALAGCGGDGRPETQPAPDVTRFTEGAFEGLPLFPRSEPVGARNEKNDTTARSYKTTNATPRQVLRFYERQLPGWQQVQAVEKVGATAYRAAWTKDGRRLLISAAPAPVLREQNETEDPVIQYSLTLGPDR